MRADDEDGGADQRSNAMPVPEGGRRRTRSPGREGKQGRAPRPARGRDRQGSKRHRMQGRERRAQLLKCAVAACAGKGVSRTGHAEVARLAKVSVPTVFSYFPTRRKLLEEVLKEVRRYILASVHEAMEGRSDPADKLFAAMWACTTRAKTDRDYFRVWLDWSTAIREDTWPRYVKFQEELIAIYEAAVREGQKAGTINQRLDAADAARILMGESHMLALMVFSCVGEARIEGFLRHLFASLLPSNVAQDRDPGERTFSSR